MLHFFLEYAALLVWNKQQIYTIQFKTDSTFLGRSDCNDLFGKFELISNNNLNILQIFTTKVNCGDNSLDIDFFQAIESAKSYIISRDKLIIFYENKSKLVFHGQEF